LIPGFKLQPFGNAVPEIDAEAGKSTVLFRYQRRDDARHDADGRRLVLCQR
jgi:hypothetical protein